MGHIDIMQSTALEFQSHDDNAEGLELTPSDPTIEPVLFSAVKKELNVRHTEHDDKIRRHIRTAVTDVERYIKRAIIQREHIAYWRYAPKWVELPRPPHQSITEIVRLDEDGTETTVATSDYETKGNKALQIIFDSINTTDAVKVAYEAGYGTKLDDMPRGIQDAIIEQVPFYYAKARPEGGIQVGEQSMLTIPSQAAAKNYKYYYNGI